MKGHDTLEYISVEFGKIPKMGRELKDLTRMFSNKVALSHDTEGFD